MSDDDGEFVLPEPDPQYVSPEWIAALSAVNPIDHASFAIDWEDDDVVSPPPAARWSVKVTIGETRMPGPSVELETP